MLLDVADFVRPRLSIVDAIVGMEGKGPGTGGKPRQLGVLLAGTDTVAMDVACCRIAGIDTGAVPVLVAARDEACGAAVPPMSTRSGCRWPTCW